MNTLPQDRQTISNAPHILHQNTSYKNKIQAIIVIVINVVLFWRLEHIFLWKLIFQVTEHWGCNCRSLGWKMINADSLYIDIKLIIFFFLFYSLVPTYDVPFHCIMTRSTSMKLDSEVITMLVRWYWLHQWTTLASCPLITPSLPPPLSFMFFNYL